VTCANTTRSGVRSCYALETTRETAVPMFGRMRKLIPLTLVFAFVYAVLGPLGCGDGSEQSAATVAGASWMKSWFSRASTMNSAKSTRRVRLLSRMGSPRCRLQTGKPREKAKHFEEGLQAPGVHVLPVFGDMPAAGEDQTRARDEISGRRASSTPTRAPIALQRPGSCMDFATGVARR
jgi:hypothetical protein